MSDRLRVVHYLNQFFAGVGGDNFFNDEREQAHAKVRELMSFLH